MWHLCARSGKTPTIKTKILGLRLCFHMEHRAARGVSNFRQYSNGKYDGKMQLSGTRDGVFFWGKCISSGHRRGEFDKCSDRITRCNIGCWKTSPVPGYLDQSICNLKSINRKANGKRQTTNGSDKETGCGCGSDCDSCPGLSSAQLRCC